MKIPVSEHQIQTSIIHYLGYKGYYTQRMNSGAIRTEKGGLVRMNKAGTPDIMAFKMGTGVLYCHDMPDYDQHSYPNLKLLFIEVKRPGKKATPLQLAMMEELTKYGARCIIATSVEDLEKLSI